MSDAPVQETRNDAALRGVMLIAYALFVVAIFNGATAIAGVVLVYLQRDAARGTIWESHCRNLTHVFWISLVALGLITAIVLGSFGGFFYSMIASSGEAMMPLTGVAILALPVLLLAGFLFTVWYLFRTLKGVIRALEDKAY